MMSADQDGSTIETAARKVVQSASSMGKDGASALDILLSCLQKAQANQSLKCESPSFIRMSSLAGAREVLEASGFVPKISKDSKVGRYITNEHKRELDRLKHYPPHLKSMAKHFKVNLKIDYNAAMEYVKQLWEIEIEKAGDKKDTLIKVENKILHRIRSIEELKDGKGNLRFHRNKTNRRIDTNLTNMGKDLRPFLIGYDNLSYLDLCNSQPVLFNIILKGINTKNNPKLKREMEE
jgi:hypothetical protein